jgi:hypothetical protein
MKTYQEQALRTLSTNYFPQSIDNFDLEYEFKKIEKSSLMLNEIKKRLFYGKINSNLILPGSNCKAIKKENIQVLHGIIGLCTEVGELMQIAINLATNPKFDLKEIRPNLIEELGDLRWYIAIILSAVNSTDGVCESANLAKLIARFPEKFTLEKCENRDLIEENKILEATTKNNFCLEFIEGNWHIMQNKASIAVFCGGDETKAQDFINLCNSK